MLPMTVRILAVADIYHALTEPRPHRAAQPAGTAADELRRQVRSGLLDDDAVRAVLTVAGHRQRATRRVWVAGLSDREIEVLRLVARGHSNRQMASLLGISERTIHHHIEHIYDKIDVSTRAGATLFAMQHNLLTDLDDAPK
jgi:DNA-binding NarL/FixJ family response regulator